VPTVRPTNTDGRPHAGWRAVPWAIAGLLLAAPWLAMRLTDEVRWTGVDFALAAVLLAGLAALVDVALFRPADRCWRAGALVAAMTGFLLLWGTLAVGLIHDEAHPANLAVAVVLAIAVIGSLLARGESRRLGRVLVATAVAQGLVAALAVALGDTAGALAALAFTGGWSLAALLFRRADARTGLGGSA
jgi:hypothetical protein